MEISKIPSLNSALNGHQISLNRPISKYENKFNNTGISPVGKWASQHVQPVKTKQFISNQPIQDEKIILNYNSSPQKQYHNIEFNSNLSQSYPKDNIFSILEPASVSSNLKDLNKLENYLSQIQQSEKLNNLSAHVNQGLLSNKFDHLKQFASLAKY
jgi:hypothetical protein